VAPRLERGKREAPFIRILCSDSKRKRKKKQGKGWTAGHAICPIIKKKRRENNVSVQSGLPSQKRKEKGKRGREKTPGFQ